MATRTIPLLALAELAPNQEADLFALMSAKEALTTRDGKPYWKVGFRDARREVSFPIWADSPWSADCRDNWTPGAFYKLRAIYRETNYGPQLDIVKIREAVPADEAEGFDPGMCLPQSRFAPATMFAELVGIARDKIGNLALRALVIGIMQENAERLLVLPAATRNHHAFVGGYLEHVLSVTRNCVLLGEKYSALYPELRPPLNVDLVVAGGILHDIGKLHELELKPEGAAYSASGNLIGHLVQGRDIVRDAAQRFPVDADVLLRLEHIILSHQRLPEWGSPKPPMTPEALIVHYADDLDARFEMMYAALRDDTNPGHMTSNKNTLYQKIYRGTT